MSKPLDERAVNSLLYGIAYTLNKNMGKSAEAIFKQAINEAEKNFKVPKVNSIEEAEQIIPKLITDIGFADSVTTEKTDAGYILDVQKCKFWPFTRDLREHNIPNFTCILGNIVTAYLQNDLGIRARIGNITGDENGSRVEINIVK